jgi:SAM-dependent methyltransferase
MTGERAGNAAPGLFEGTAHYYSRYRPAYPDELFDLLVDRFDLGPEANVVDLGCGTGQLAIPLASRGIPVQGIDPSVEMLCEALREEERADALGVRWTRGSDASIGDLHLPATRLVTMGASFHWMDRDGVLRALDRHVDAAGGIAVVSADVSVWREASAEPPSWSAVAREVITEMLGAARRAGAGTYEHPPERHEAILERSPFSQVEVHRFEKQHAMTVDDIVGLQLSTSYASPRQLGDRLDSFRAELARRLTELEASGVFETTTRTEVLVATRG